MFPIRAQQFAWWNLVAAVAAFEGEVVLRRYLVSDVSLEVDASFLRGK